MSGKPHVTAILKDAGMIDTSWFTEEARQRGTALHMATHFLDQGDLRWETVDPVILPRLRQYQKFLREMEVQILAIEERVENETYNYCGTLDRRDLINGVEGIIDIKPPGSAPWHGVQLAMYAHCFDRPMRRWTLHLHDDRYQLIAKTNRRDWEVAKAAMIVTAWREENL